MPAEENIALIHRGLDAFSRGDLDGALRICSRTLSGTSRSGFLICPWTRRSTTAMTRPWRLWAAFRSGWATLTVTLEAVVDAREDVVVGRTRFVGQGSASGIEVDRTVFMCSRSAGKLGDCGRSTQMPKPRSRRAVGVGDVAGEPENRSRDLRSVRNQRSGLQGLQPLGRGRRRSPARRLARER